MRKKLFSFLTHNTIHIRLVLGIRHAAVATRDVALYQPFRNALRSTNHVIGLPTLMWQLMRRRVQETHVCPVCTIPGNSFY